MIVPMNLHISGEVCMALPRSRVTSRDVAHAAGVSLNTVSLVVKNSPLVAQPTKARVQAVIAELGYRPHAAAAALRSTRSHTLGFLVPWGYDRQPVSPELTAELYPTIDVFRNVLLNAMTAQARSAGYYFLLDTFADVQHCLTLVGSARIDGALVDMLISDLMLKELIARGVPLVLVGRDAGDLPVSWVKADEAGGAYTATRHLLALGHRRFGAISAANEHTHAVVRERLNGYRRALDEAGIESEPGSVVPGDWSFQSGYALGRELLSRPIPPTALFVLSEIMAAGAQQSALDLGLRIPDDLAIVTIEGSPLVEYVRPQLSAVHVPMYAVGLRAAEVLLSLLNEPVDEPYRIVLPTTFIVRESSAPVPGVSGAVPSLLPSLKPLTQATPYASNQVGEGGAVTVS
jgi:LacI family transcriptional regulator, galactose operon repressor